MENICRQIKGNYEACAFNRKIDFNRLFNIFSYKCLRQLTSLGWMTCKHTNYFRATDQRASIHAFLFLCVFAGRLAIMAVDVYTRSGGPGQKALQAMNEFTLFVEFCLIPLSKTCDFDVPAKNL